MKIYGVEEASISGISPGQKKHEDSGENQISVQVRFTNLKGRTAPSRGSNLASVSTPLTPASLTYPTGPIRW